MVGECLNDLPPQAASRMIETVIVPLCNGTFFYLPRATEDLRGYKKIVKELPCLDGNRFHKWARCERLNIIGLGGASYMQHEQFRVSTGWHKNADWIPADNTLVCSALKIT
jgi:hypothetical protein